MHAPLNFSVRRPLLSLETSAALADLTTEAVMDLIRDGTLRFAFNVATPDAGRQCLRVLAVSLADYLNGTHNSKRLLETPAQVRAAVAGIFPALAGDTLRIDTFCRLLSISLDHGARLAETCVQRARHGRRGQNCGTLIVRASALEFLLKRRVT